MTDGNQLSTTIFFSCGECDVVWCEVYAKLTESAWNVGAGPGYDWLVLQCSFSRYFQPEPTLKWAALSSRPSVAANNWPGWDGLGNTHTWGETYLVGKIFLSAAYLLQISNIEHIFVQPRDVKIV